ncbi:hypothetical protein Moror_10608 [Moniliophthora roreri MCA 2997]|uniref:RING-type domain-containing protein n=1 Tax=Moniliophthora roreri (strain MCA 2997) TaxID=1381753 RepID=V2YJA8_MONRO|nr:hypothetical protein Moror_10608 [Moniliophthora roreri MCA 2997]
MANPATPQRTTRGAHNPHAHSISHPYIRDPVSPPSPYTPLSLRSFPSSNASPASTLATPNSVANISPAFKRPSFSSPQVSRLSSHMRSSSSSIADLTHNWRNRATENGIKVAADDSYLDDADVSLSDTSGFTNADDIPPPQPFMSAHRRRAFSQSNVGVLPPVPNVPRTPVNRRLQPTSPLVRRTLSSLNPNTATPPPKRNLAQQLRLKGSFTDPPQLRKREAFGVVPVASQNIPTNTNGDASFELFDIDENDYEYEYEYENDQQHGLELKGVDDSMEYEYPSVGNPQLSGHPQQHQQPSHAVNFHHPQNYPMNPTVLSLFGQPTFADPFGGPGTIGAGSALNGRIADSVEQHFNQYQQQQQAYANRAPPGLGLPMNVGLRGPSHLQNPSQGYPVGAHLAPNHIAVHLRQPSGHMQSSPIPSISHLTPSLTPSPHAPSLPLHHPEPSDIHQNGYPVERSSSAPTMAPSMRGASPGASLTANAVTVGDTQPPTSCAVCSRTNLTRLAILSPCGHPLCSACLTSALNIVGEKDMECASCKQEVVDFKLVTNSTATGSANTSISSSGDDSKKPGKKQTLERGKTFTEPLFSSPGSAHSGLESAFEFNGYMPDFDPDDVFSIGTFGAEENVIRASTPPPKSKVKVYARDTGVSETMEQTSSLKRDLIVLRIDNVPWDITPPRISAWLQQPIVRVHVLLDRKGKTMSHAFVEVDGEETAGAILRGEAKTEGGKPKLRGTVLGKGRRARGVTVTRSSQQELMSALFPAWQGSFDGSRPSLAGLDNDRVIGALESGLMTESEVAALLYLIRSPDAHFLKVPCLPFHSLISILYKFPADVDSRVFWSGTLRDVLFDVAFAAIQVLMARVESRKNNDEYNPDLVDDLVKASLQCQAFTSVQTKKISQLMQATRQQIEQSSVSVPQDLVSSPSSMVLSRRMATQSRSPSVSSRGSHYSRPRSRLNTSHSMSAVASSPAHSSRSFASISGDADDEDDGLDSACDESSFAQFQTPDTLSSATAASSRSDQVLPLPIAEQITAPAEIAVPTSTEAAATERQTASLGDLAKEFGVEPHLVEALAQRLAAMR